MILKHGQPFTIQLGSFISFPNPDNALFNHPRKVLIDNNQTKCFLKRCNSGAQARQELKMRKMIHAAGLDS